MYKNIYLLIFFILFANCTKNSKLEINNTLTNESTAENNYEFYKKKLIQYGINGKFPDINK